MGKLGKHMADKIYKEKNIDQYCAEIDKMIAKKDKYIRLKEKIKKYSEQERGTLRLECNSNVADTEKAIVFECALPTILCVPFVDIIKDYVQASWKVGLKSTLVLVVFVAILCLVIIARASSLVMENREYLYIIQIIEEVNNEERENRKNQIRKRIAKRKRARGKFMKHDIMVMLRR